MQLHLVPVQGSVTAGVTIGRGTVAAADSAGGGDSAIAKQQLHDDTHAEC